MYCENYFLTEISRFSSQYFGDKYQQMQDHASILNQNFSKFVFVIFATSLPMACFVLFTILSDNNLTISEYLAFTFWLLLLLLQLSSIYIPAILVHEEVSNIFLHALFTCGILQLLSLVTNMPTTS